MKPWRSYYAFSRLKSCIEDLVHEVSLCLESDLTGATPAGSDAVAEMADCTDKLLSVCGVLRAMEYNEFALYVDELHRLYQLSRSLDPDKDVDRLNDIRELLYLVIVDFPALLEGVLSGQIRDWHEYSGMFNRMRKARHAGLIFSSDSLLTRQEIDFRAVFSTNRSRYTQILERHLHHYREARKLLMKGQDTARGCDAMQRVFSGLATVCRDYRLSTLWGMCSALAASIPDELGSIDAQPVRLLCSFTSIIEAVTTRGPGALEQNIPEDILEKVLDAFSHPLNATGSVLAVRQWFNLDLKMNRQQRQRYRALVVGYSGREAVIRTIGLLNEQIAGLLGIINEVAGGGTQQDTLSEEHLAQLRQIRDTLRALGMSELVKVMDGALDAGGLSSTVTQQSHETGTEKRLEAFARALYHCELGLQARQEELERAVFASRAGQSGVQSLTGPRMAIVLEALRNLERVVIAINHYADDGQDGPRLAEAIPLLQSAETALGTIPEKSAAGWCAVARQYIERITGTAHPVSLDREFHHFAHLVINTILYLEQLGIGHMGELSEVCGENDRLAERVAQAGAAKTDVTESGYQPEAPVPADSLTDPDGQDDSITDDAVVIPFRQNESQIVEDPDSATATGGDGAVTTTGVESSSGQHDGLPVQTAEADHGIESADNEPAFAEPGASVAAVVDAELRQVFVDEAEEILPEMTENFAILESTPDDIQALTELRRGFHTLKGSGRMVQALAIAELAWAAERILNQHISLRQPVSENLLRALTSVLAAVPDMVTAFSQQASVAMDVEAAAPLIEDLVSADAQEVDAGLHESPDDCDSAADEKLSDPDTTTCREQDEILDSGPETDVAVEDDRDQLFIREAERHVASIRTLLAKSAGGPIAIDSLQIAVHTLHGSCRVAGQSAFAGLVGRLENTLQETSHLVTQSQLTPLLSDFCDITERFLNAYGPERPQADVTLDGDVQVFLHRLDNLVDPPATQVDDQTGGNDEAALLLQGFLGEARPLYADLKAIMDDADSSATLTVGNADRLKRLCTQLEGAAEVANRDMLARLCHALAVMADHVLKEDCPATQALLSAALLCQQQIVRIMGDLEDGRDPSVTTEAQEAVSGLESALRSAISVHQQRVRLEAEQAVENDLIRVFDDEASELLQELDTGLADWQQSPDEFVIVDDIARHLHTLKGSAALVGQALMSETAHAFESLLLEGRQQGIPDRAFFTQAENLLGQLQEQFARFRADVQRDDTSDTPVIDGLAMDANEAGSGVASVSTAQQEGEYKADTTGPDNVVSIDEARPQAQTIPASIPIDEYVRVSGNLLQRLLNDADEIDVSRNRMEQVLSENRLMMDDMQETLGRLSTYLQRFEQQARPSVASVTSNQQSSHADDFDALEMDRYTELQQIWLSLSEDYDDLYEIRSNLLNRMRFMDNILSDQQRATHKLQDGLISSQMVPFSSIVPRLRRLVRQVAQDLDKSVTIRFSNPEGKIDRSMLQTVVGPIEHMIRNAIDHGIEQIADRRALGKAEHAELLVKLSRQGANITLDITDDGRGIDPDRIRARALREGLLTADQQLSDQELCQLILRAGFSTSDSISKISGRGVGLDVVQEEIHQIGGELEIFSRKGMGTTFRIRLPLSSSLNRALLFQLQGQDYVMLLNTIDGIVMEKAAKLQQYYQNRERATFDYHGEQYELAYLGGLLGSRSSPDSGLVMQDSVPLLLVSGQQRRIALHVDGITGTRELVVRSLGPQFMSVPSVSGGVILGDGRVVIVLDPISLVDQADSERLNDADRIFNRMKEEALEDSSARTVLVVDDSITVRKVTSAILERNGMKVLLARDGMEAVEILQKTLPDVMLLDIEMPKMDGFEVASYIRRQQGAVKDIPIIMITSRIGDKHRNRAEQIGVDQYMCKPFQEQNLLEAIAGYQ